jgi:hypothetical protein
MKNNYYIALYLIAIIAANLTVIWLGPSVTIINAFLFIGLDLTSRDKLHDVWHGNGLIWKMFALIASGSLLSWIINRNAGSVALASFIAFACANTVDALVYQLLHTKAKILKINGSNVVSAAVDSFVFPMLAFGFPLLWSVMIGQFAAKVVGGFIWSIILNRGLTKDIGQETLLPDTTQPET